MTTGRSHYTWATQPGIPPHKTAMLLRRKIKEKRASIAILEEELAKVQLQMRARKKQPCGPCNSKA